MFGTCVEDNSYSCVFLLPGVGFPLPFPCMVMVLCSDSLDAKYVWYSRPSSLDVLPCFVSVRISMFVLVRVIQILSS